MRITDRDRAVLHAVADGRCEVSAGAGTPLVIDGLCCCDQFAGVRLADAGLIDVPAPRPGPARLTPSGQALLEAA